MEWNKYDSLAPAVKQNIAKRFVIKPKTDGLTAYAQALICYARGKFY